MPDRPSRRDLPLPGAYSGECLRCGGSVPKTVRSGLAAYFCSDCWRSVEARASGLDPAFQSQPPVGRLEDE